MAVIDSVKLPDNSTYDVADNYSGYQKATLATPITINGTQKTNVEGALGGLNDYGDALADNLAANEESGAKNHADASTATTERLSNNNGVFTNTVADDYTYFHMYIQAWTGGTFISNIANQGITATGDYSYNITIPSGTDTLQIVHNGGIYDLRAKFNCDVEGDYIISFRVLGTDPRTIGGLSFDKVMLRDARVIDPTFAPFAETNLQLTQNKAERDDLSTIHATGSTNTTGATIANGTFFYLNGQFCKALQGIAANATFTLNTNFKVDSVGEELNSLYPTYIGDCLGSDATLNNLIQNYCSSLPYGLHFATVEDNSGTSILGGGSKAVLILKWNSSYYTVMAYGYAATSANAPIYKGSFYAGTFQGFVKISPVSP